MASTDFGTRCVSPDAFPNATRQGAYWRLYEAQARQVDKEEQLQLLFPEHAAPPGAVTMAFQFERKPFGRLVLTLADGTVHEGVAPVRAFPLTASKEGVSLVGTDGRKIARVPVLGELPREARALIEEELAVREFVPTVQRIEAVSSFSTQVLGM